MAGKELKKYLIQSFGGGNVNDISPIYQKDSSLPEAPNVDFSLERGAASKRRGYLRVNDGNGLDGAVTGFHQSYIGGAWRNVIMAGSKAYDWDQPNDTANTIGTGLADSKNYLCDFTSAMTDTDGPVMLITNGQDQVQKYNGGTIATLTDLSLSEGYNYFKCKHLAAFNNYYFFANTWEGEVLADTWTLTSSTIYSHDSHNSVLDVAEVWNGSSELTQETATPTTPGVGEFGISSHVLYVNTGGAPGAVINITYKNYERVRWSDIGNAEGYSALNFIDVVTEPGQEIRAIVPLRDLLIVYKEDSIWAINYTGDASAPFGLFPIDLNTPCIAGHSVADVKGEHYFLSEEGIMKTNGAKVDPLLVSKEVEEWFSYVSRTDWKYSYGSVNEYRKEYRLLIPYQGGDDVTDKDREIRYDYEHNTWSVHNYAGNANVIGTMILSEAGTWDSISRYWDEIEVSWEHPSLWARYTRYFTGDYNGYLRLHDQVNRDEEATDQAIEAYLFTKPLNLTEDLSEVKNDKRLHKLWLRLKSYDGSTLKVFVRRDRQGDFEFVEDIDLGRGEREFTTFVSLSGQCKEVEYKVGNNATGQPWSVYFMETEFLMRSDK